MLKKIGLVIAAMMMLPALASAAGRSQPLSTTQLKSKVLSSIHSKFGTIGSSGGPLKISFAKAGPVSSTFSALGNKGAHGMQFSVTGTISRNTGRVSGLAQRMMSIKPAPSAGAASLGSLYHNGTIDFGELNRRAGGNI